MTTQFVSRCAAIGVALMIAAPAAWPADITGTVVNITNGGTPVPNADVTLHGMNGDLETLTRTAKAGADGVFRFRGIAPDAASEFRLGTQYAGQYQSSQPFPASKGIVNQNLAVYDTTNSPDDISIEKTHVIVQPDGGVFHVIMIYIVQNWGGIYLGDPPTASDSKRMGVRFLVPPDANNLQFIMPGIVGPHHQMMPWGFASTVPFYPGSDTVGFQYDVSWDGRHGEFHVESPYKISSMSVIAEKDKGDLRVEGAKVQDTQMGAPGMPKGLVDYERFDIPPKTPVAIEVLPPAGAKGAFIGNLDAGQWLMVVAGIAMIAVILFAVYVRQRHSGEISAAPARDARDVAGVAPEEPYQSPSAPPAEAHSSGAVDALVKQIADLDDSYEKGQIGEGDYVTQRRALKAELIRRVKAE